MKEASHRFTTKFWYSQKTVRWCSVKKIFLKCFQNSQENTCISLALTKRQPFNLKFYQKIDSGIGAFLWILRNWRNTYSAEHLRIFLNSFKTLWKTSMLAFVLCIKLQACSYFQCIQLNGTKENCGTGTLKIWKIF